MSSIATSDFLRIKLTLSVWRFQYNILITVLIKERVIIKESWGFF